jgi:pilus assembly protein CpaF
MERGVIQMQEIFRFQRLGFFDDGKVRGQFMPCGYVPTFYEELREQGVDLDLSIFGADNEEMNRHVSGQVGNA